MGWYNYNNARSFHQVVVKIPTVAIMGDLKLKFSQYPAIHTNYLISHWTNMFIIFDTVLRQKQICKRER